MKYFKHIFGVFLVVLLSLSSCSQESLPVLTGVLAPTNISVTANITTDGSGKVSFIATANDAIVYQFFFGNSDSENPYVSSDGTATNLYKKTGTNTYLVKVVAFGRGGLSSTKTLKVTVFVDFVVPATLIKSLTNNGTKNWYWKQSETGHLGVGPEFDANGNVSSDASYYEAAPNDKQSVGCLYEDVLTFTDNGNGTYSYTLDNKGNTYFNKDETQDALGIPNPGQDNCFPYDTSSAKDILFSGINSGVSPSTGVNMEFTNGGFMSYFLGSSSYEIMNITDTDLRVRVIQDINGSKLAWYQTFTSVKPSPSFTNLVWSDEFDVDGTPNPANWDYDQGTGTNGWGNNEAQYYTNSTNNVSVSGGMLHITAKKENFSGSAYTSARIKTQGLFSFKYGKIEVRAKLPEGGGTWPAIWMLGSNFSTVGWPASGEIDIMEHIGNDLGTIHGSIHTPSSSGNTVNTGTKFVSDATTTFHVYTVNWTSEKIEFLIDDVVYYTYNPSVKNSDTWPFDANQFIILNVAMGGNFGGTIDPTFTSASMDIDYVRVYQ